MRTPAGGILRTVAHRRKEGGVVYGLRVELRAYSSLQGKTAEEQLLTCLH